MPRGQPAIPKTEDLRRLRASSTDVRAEREGGERERGGVEEESMRRRRFVLSADAPGAAVTSGTRPHFLKGTAPAAGWG